jgi:UPF0755 protein
MKQRRNIILALIAVLFFFFVYEIFWAPNTFENDRFIIVSKGENFSQVADSLQHAGIIRNRFLFVFAGRVLNLTTRMQIGKYRFKSGMSNKEILEDLRLGKTIEFITVTVPEGLKATRVARIYARTLGIDSSRFMLFVNNSEFAQSLGAGSNTLEGYLMPKTYKFYWQEDEGVIAEEMVEQFWNIFDDSLRSSIGVRGFSLHEILTLASIIEAETAIDSERTLVAGVYYNRLKKNMRIEADPTVQYIIEDGPRRLRYSDLHRESPYNTYRHYGLPPGPINNPGKASIIAALYPKRHRYLYFVANGQGGHTFSKTFADHQRAKQKYKKSEKNNG